MIDVQSTQFPSPNTTPSTGLAPHWRIAIGLALGVFVGLILNTWGTSIWSAVGVGDSGSFMKNLASTANAHAGFGASILKFIVDANAFIGQVFIRLLRMTAVPIVLVSIILAVASVGNLRQLGRLGLKTVGVYALTATLSVIIGLCVVNTVRPGSHVSADARSAMLATYAARADELGAKTDQIASVWQQLLAAVPANPVDALARGDMLAIITFGVLLGIGLALLPAQRTRTTIDVLQVFSDVLSWLVRAVMAVAPIAVFCLLAPVVANLGIDVLRALGVYALCVVGGLLLILAIVYAPVIAILGRVNPLVFFRAMMPAQLVAFSSSSSNATLPVTIECLERRLNVPPKVAGFVCPLGATINMDGTAMYLTVTAVFIAQAFGIELSLGQQLMLLAGAIFGAIGTPGIPGGSLVVLIALLGTMGVPPSGVAIILGIDRLLDMCRTVVNVAGDGVASVVIARSER